jgi:hypothetical protein
MQLNILDPLARAALVLAAVELLGIVPSWTIGAIQVDLN